MPANAQSNPNFFNFPGSFTNETAAKALVDAQAKATKTAADLPVVSKQPNKAISTNVDENNKKGSTNISIYATGLGATANTGIKIANQSLSHACDSSSYVGMAIAQAGGFARQVVISIRTAIQAILKALGVSPSSNGFVSQLKAIAQDIKAAADFVQEITNSITKFIAYLNAIKQLLAFILSLPAQLLGYFKDCIATIKKQMVASFKAAIADTAEPGDNAFDEVSKSVDEIKGSIKQFTNNLATLASTTAQAGASLVTPGQLAIANTQLQAAATADVYAAAGFTPTTMSLP
jgi:hypothetical protein